MKEYLFSIDMLQVFGENGSFSNRYISYQVETVEDAWQEFIKNLNADLLDSLDLANLKSISVRSLGELDKWHGVK